MKIITYENEEQIVELEDILHDGSIDIDNSRYSESDRMLFFDALLCEPPHKVEKTIWPFSRYYHRFRKALLVFENVMDYVLVDEARIGTADIDEIIFKEGTITVTSPHLKFFSINVKSLSIRLEISEDLIDKGSYGLGPRKPRIKLAWHP